MWPRAAACFMVCVARDSEKDFWFPTFVTGSLLLMTVKDENIAGIFDHKKT